MECRYAYMKQHIDYVLCKKEPEPTRYDREKLFHAVCAHQVHCPRENCHKLSSGWEKCTKLREAPKTAYEDIFPDMIQDPDEAFKPTRKSRRKAKTEE
jgi:hypothetical protein